MIEDVPLQDGRLLVLPLWFHVFFMVLAPAGGDEFLASILTGLGLFSPFLFQKIKSTCVLLLGRLKICLILKALL